MERVRARPGTEEFDAYYAEYVDQVPEGDVIAVLRAQREEAITLFEGIPGDKLDHRYAPGKWTTRQVIGHVLDAEWIFTYRALQFARQDRAPLPGMDPDAWMEGANFSARDLGSLVEEFRNLRGATIALFESFSDEILDRTGTASDVRFTVRALIHIIAGHAAHHLRILRERYL